MKHKVFQKLATVAVAVLMVLGLTPGIPGIGARTALAASDISIDVTASVSADSNSFTYIFSDLVIDGSGNINSATVNIDSGFSSSADTLSYGTVAGLTASYNSANGVLTVTGSAAVATYQTFLRTVAFKTTATSGTRGIVLLLNTTTGNVVYYDYTQHFYEFVSASAISWTSAKTAAESRYYEGYQGYLATITSAAENTFVTSKCTGAGWLGASDAATEGVWKWVTGPESGTTFWNGGKNGSAVVDQYNKWHINVEPDNNGDEDYLHIMGQTKPSWASTYPIGSWNDFPDAAGTNIYGYVVEYGPAAGVSLTDVSSSATVGITVSSGNTAPVFEGSTTTLTVNQNASATDIKDLLHVSDSDTGQTLAWSQNTAPNHGALSFSGTTALSGGVDIAPGGSITYTPTAGYSGSDSFAIQVSDGTATATRTIIVTVSPVEPTITTSPADDTKMVGQTASFSVSATAAVTGDHLSYQWQKAPSGSSTFADITGATGVSYTTELLAMSDSGSKYRCVVTENETELSATTSAATLTVNKQSPTVSMPTASPSGSQIYPNNVVLTATLSNYYGTLSGQKISFYNGATLLGSGTTNSSGVASCTWASPSANTYSITAQFTGDSNNNSAASSSTLSYTVRIAGADILKNLLDGLPDPHTATDAQIGDNADAIKMAKIIYDLLTDGAKSGLDPALVDKLNGLLNRLTALLVIQPKDEDTGIELTNIGTAVQVPELGSTGVSRVTLQLVADPVPTTGSTTPMNIAIAAGALDGGGKQMIAAYDLSILKTVLDADGHKIGTPGKVNNSDITAPVTVLIPVPQEYAGRTDLAVTYIDDHGVATQLESKIVTIDGVTYLRFSTMHFSVYALTISKTGGTDNIPDTADYSFDLLWWILMAVSAAGIMTILVLGRKRAINKK